MQITATENGKMIAKLINPDISSVNYISSVLAEKVSEDINRHSLREERLSKYEIND